MIPTKSNWIFDPGRGAPVTIIFAKVLAARKDLCFTGYSNIMRGKYSDRQTYNHLITGDRKPLSRLAGVLSFTSL